MVKHVLPTVLVLGLGLSQAFAEPTPPAPAKADAADVAKRINQLGSDQYEEREAACDALEALGPAALDSLRRAAASRDEEKRRRATDLVLLIKKRLEAARLTQPKLVHLVFKDTPVNVAVQEMVRKSGFQIQLEGDQNAFAKRKITLDTGDVPFWQAVDQFCAKAGLVERGSDGISETPLNTGFGSKDMVFMTDSLTYPVQPEMPLVFLNGKPRILPTHHAGALRVRALPRAVPAAGQPSAAPAHESDEGILLTLQISAEPKMGLQNVLNVRVERMVDDKGFELETPLPYISDMAGYNAVRWGGGLANSGDVDLSGQDLSKRVPLRLHIPNGVKRLREIRGSVALEVLTPHEPLVTVNDILNAADKTVTGSDGDSLKVLEVTRDEKGEVVVRVVVERAPVPQNVFPLGMGVVMFPGGGGLGGGIGGVFEANGATVGAVAEVLSLVDDKNQAFKLVAAEDQPRDNQSNEYRLTFRPASGLPKAAKLIYSGRRQTTIDVPFVLKDVPVRGG